MKWTTVIALTAGLAVVPPAMNAQENGVARLADLWTAAYNQGDVEGLGALYTEDAHLYTHGQPRTVGRDRIREFWAADMKDRNPITVLIVTDSVPGVDMMLVHGNYLVLNRETGVRLGHGRFAHIWVLNDGEWRLDRDLWNQPAFE